MKNFIKQSGPAILVTAAFIGPGTITVCTLAGVKFGYGLLWALLLSVLACIILQEMAARLGLLRQEGLAEILKGHLKQPVLRSVFLILIFSAIVIGNAAYEAGNISGAALGVNGLFPVLTSTSYNLGALLIGLLAFIILYFGSYKALERILVVLVIVMSISFLITMVLTQPDLKSVAQGLFIPQLTTDSLLTVIALVGTTVVPYNLFLHASLVSEKWHRNTPLRTVKKELFIAVGLGGVVSMSIVICAASSGLDQVSSAADLAEGLKPLFSSVSSVVLNIGLIAAGVTSSITAPLAAAYVAKGCFGWQNSIASRKFRGVWMGVLLLGIVFSSLRISPIDIIQFAQVANGLLLPLMAMVLLWLVNSKKLLGVHANTKLQNFMSVVVIVVTIFLGAKSILKVLEVL